MVIYPEYAVLDRVDPSDERRKVSYTYRGGWGDATSTSAKSDDDVLVDVGKFDPTAIVGVFRGALETLGIKPADVTSSYTNLDPGSDPTAPDPLTVTRLRLERLRQRLHRDGRRRHRQADQLPERLRSPYLGLAPVSV